MLPHSIKNLGEITPHSSNHVYPWMNIVIVGGEKLHK